MQGGGQGGERPAQAGRHHDRPAGAGSRLPRPVPGAPPAGRGPARGGALASAGIETIGGLAALEDGDLGRLLPGKVGRLLRDRARGIDPRPLELASESVSIGHEETFERDVSDRAQLHGELRRMAVSVTEQLARSGQAARTVTTKLRYPDFSIRSRSTTLAVGCADALQIGELACMLLDRALAERPSALRLVGVSVSNLEAFQQLALEA